MRARRTLLAGLACALALGSAGAALTAAPALAQTAPWEPATELFSHMTGDGSGDDAGGARLDEAVRTMVAGTVESSLELALRPLQPPAPAPRDGEEQADGDGDARPGDGQAPDGQAQDGETHGGEDPAPGHGGHGHGGDGHQEEGHGDQGHPGEVRFTSAPVAAHARREPCERAGGTLVEVREHTQEGVLALGVACVPPEHALLDERAALRALARQRLRTIQPPGGRLTATLEEGLAWIPSTLRLTGEGRCPAELRLTAPRPTPTGPAGAGDAAVPAPRVLDVACTVAEREWFFGDGERARTPAATTTVEHTYRRRGRYPVTVRSTWRVRAHLDGEPLAEATLVSEATLRYPVAELRAVLTR